MGYDENRISDQIDGGLQDKKDMQERIIQLEAENKELKEKIKRVEDSLMSDEEITNQYGGVSFEYIDGASNQRDLIKKALEG